jgi:hypothetical protein
MSVKDKFISTRVQPKKRIPYNANPSGNQPAASGLGVAQKDDTFNLKTYIEQVTDEVLSTGASAQTTALTDITFTAPGTADYVIQDLVDVDGFGFVTKDEGNTVLSVIKNLQDRVSELEARLAALSIIS